MAAMSSDAWADHLPGLKMEHKVKTLESNSAFGHYHQLSAITRGQFEREVYGKLRRDYPGDWVVIGGSPREVKAAGDKVHVCAMHVGTHDVGYNAGDHDHATCTYPAELVVSTDLLYYEQPMDIVRRMLQHQAKAAVYMSCVPFIGGGGTLFGGEASWKRLNGDVVLVQTDRVTRESWQHSDLCWLIETTGMQLYKRGHGIDGYLVWNFVQAGGGRMAVKFELTVGPIVIVRNPLPTLDGWIRGDSAMMDQYAHNDICYTAKQVARALGRYHSDAGDELVKVSDVKDITRWLLGNPQRASLWECIAAQRCKGLKVKEVAYTVDLALFFAREAVANKARSGWYRFNAEWWRSMRAKLSYWTSWLPSTSVSVLDPRIIAGFISCPSILGPIGDVSGIEYICPSLVTTCTPSVGVFSSDRGVLRVDDCVCEPRTTHLLAGISVCHEYLVVPCACAKSLGTAFRKRVIDVANPSWIDLEILPEDGQDPREPVPDCIIERYVSVACRNMRSYLGVMSGVIGSHRPTFDAWVNNPKWTDVTRERLRTWRNAGNTTDASGGVSAFVKCEISIKPGEVHLSAADEIKPRAIQPVDMQRRCEIGPGLTSYQHSLKLCLAADTSVVWTAGMTSEEVGRQIEAAVASIQGPVAYINADYGAFDGTNRLTTGQQFSAASGALLGVPTSEIEYDFANARSAKVQFGLSDKYAGAKVVLEQVSPSCASGHDKTSSGNAAANAVVHHAVQRDMYPTSRWAYRQTDYEAPDGWVPNDWWKPLMLSDPFTRKNMVRALTTHDDDTSVQALAALAAAVSDVGTRIVQARCPAVTLVNGDDGLTILPASDAEEYLKRFNLTSRRFGFKPEAVIAEGDWDAEFCSMLLWPTDCGIVPGPKPGRIMARTGFKRAHNQKAFMSQVRGDALGLLTSVNHIPILRAWSAALLRCTTGKVLRETTEKFKTRCATAHPLVEEAWAFATERYGLSKEVLLELEGQLAQVTRLPVVLSHPAWSQIVLRDS